MDWDDIWGGLSEAAGETWDIVSSVAGETLRNTVQTVKEAGTSVETLRENAPIKGTNPDGSPIVVQNAAYTGSSAQYIQGVDNTVVLIGGTLLVVGLFYFMAKGRG